MSPEVVLTIFEALAIICFLIGYGFHGLAKLDTYDNPGRKANAKDLISIYFTIFSLFFFIAGIIYFGYTNKSYNDVSSFINFVNVSNPNIF